MNTPNPDDDGPTTIPPREDYWALKAERDALRKRVSALEAALTDTLSLAELLMPLKIDAPGFKRARAALSPPPSPQEPPAEADPLNLNGTCEDQRLIGAGYLVCGSNANREWHWRPPSGPWHDGHRTEDAAVRAALKHLAAQPSTQEEKG